MRRSRTVAAPRPAGVLLGWGALAVGVASLLFPGLVGRAIRMEPATVRAIAVRDLASAWLILGWGGRLAFATRAMFDLADAGMMARRRPLAAAVATAAAVLGAKEALAPADRG